jgi:hypothetical protein
MMTIQLKDAEAPKLCRIITGDATRLKLSLGDLAILLSLIPGDGRVKKRRALTGLRALIRMVTLRSSADRTGLLAVSYTVVMGFSQ